MFSLPSVAQDSTGPAVFPFKDYRSDSPATITKVIDATTLYASNKKIFRLDGVRIPDQFVPEDFASPFHDKALALMQDEFENKNIRLYIPRSLREFPENRFEHKLGQIIREDNKLWAQKFLLENGLALAWPSPYTTEIWPLLLMAEKVAKESQIGLWARENGFSIQSPETVEPDAYKLQIVEGEIYKLASVKNQLYLNFGENWRTDFTVTVPAELRKEYASRGYNMTNWQGKKIRVRGFVEEYNGPMIKITYADQIELIEEEQSEAPIETQESVLEVEF